MTSRQLAKEKLAELKSELSLELRNILPNNHPNKHINEQRIFLLSVQIHALKKNINYKFEEI